MKNKKPTGLVCCRGKYYCRVIINNRDKKIPLQTFNELIAHERCNSINMYRKFLINGELTADEVTFKPEIATWYRHNESKIEPLTLESLSEKWLKMKKVEVAKSTAKDNARNIKTIINIICNKKVKDLVIDDIDNFKVLRKGQVADTSINRELVIFKAFVNWLYDRHYIDRPLKIKQIPIKKDPRPKYISERDFKRLMLEETIPDWIKDACKVYWYTGCRKMELVEGKLIGNRLVIDSSISKSGREFACTIPTILIPLVKEIHARRDEYIEKYKIESFGDYISDKVIDGYKRLGIYEINRTKLHSLRHSFGCRMYLITADIKEVGKMMNHKDRTSTDQYVGYTQDLLIDFPSDGKHSAFRDNMKRVGKANSDVLRYLEPKLGTNKWAHNRFHEGSYPHS